MSPAAWAFFSVLTTTQTKSLLDLAKLKAGARRTGATVERVKTLAEPTGDGFAERIEGKLDRVIDEAAQERRRLSRHIDDHASADLRRKVR